MNSLSIFLFCYLGTKKVDYCRRIPYRIKKWWFPIYTWSLSVSAVNSWRLRMRVTGKKEPFLNFLRELCIEMLSKHGTAPSR